MRQYRASIDFVLFNLCWIANALSGLHEIVYLGPAVALLAVVVHLLLLDDFWSEILFLIVLATTGYVWDTLIYRVNVIGFPTAKTAVMVPVWLFAQWVAFGLLFRHSIRWLRERYLLAGLLGAFGGPLSYYSATRLNVLSLGRPIWQSLLVLGIGWALIVPIFGHISQRYEHLSLDQT